MSDTSALIERLTELAAVKASCAWIAVPAYPVPEHQTIPVRQSDLAEVVAFLTALSGRAERAREMLAEAAEVLDRYSDASQEPGDSYAHPNAAMRMMHEINEELDRA